MAPPPCVPNHASFFTNNLMKPLPCFVVDWFAHGTQDPQRRPENESSYRQVLLLLNFLCYKYLKTVQWILPVIFLHPFGTKSKQ